MALLYSGLYGSDGEIGQRGKRGTLRRMADVPTTPPPDSADASAVGAHEGKQPDLDMTPDAHSSRTPTAIRSPSLMA
jgi:hypothetical protein